MSTEMWVICNGCGERVHPPENRGWFVVAVTAMDGVNLADIHAHLCDSCKVDFRQWLEVLRKANDSKRAGRPS
jgi:hypothetical protein